jgi:hypothetical protein
VICFDEIFCYKTNDLYKIYNFMNTHIHIKYYCSGDVNQNRPINDVTIDIPNVITLIYISIVTSFIGLF